MRSLSLIWRGALGLLFGAVLVSRALAASGPTLHLDYGHGQPQTNGVRDFMYFVPLISPEPVSVLASAGNSQNVRVLSFSCHTNREKFFATCEFEFIGSGSLQNVFDHSQLIAHRKKHLESGETLARQLSAITVNGSGFGTVEISGGWTNGAQRVDELRLNFDAHGKISPVSIVLQDLVYRDGVVKTENELVARINSLMFERTTNAPKMHVTLASIKRKDAADSRWQNFIGGLKGSLANLFIPPLAIQKEGHQAMLDFGRALATESPQFTFPHANRLQEKSLAEKPAVAK